MTHLFETDLSRRCVDMGVSQEDLDYIVTENVQALVRGGQPSRIEGRLGE